MRCNILKDGLPSVDIRSPVEFYERIEKDAKNAGNYEVVWNGELVTFIDIWF